MTHEAPEGVFAKHTGAGLLLRLLPGAALIDFGISGIHEGQLTVALAAAVALPPKCRSPFRRFPRIPVPARVAAALAPSGRTAYFFTPFAASGSSE